MFLSLLEACRPRQWIKNTFVFAGLIFAKKFDDPNLWARAGLCFVVFCLVASGVYLINDLRDIEEDRRHPQKRQRPIARGDVSPAVAWPVAAVLIALGLLGSSLLNLGTLAWVAVYVVKEMLYSYWFKHVVIVDILVNSLGFLIRAVAGIRAIQLPGAEHVAISTWFLACIFFLSLFIACAKRRHELVILQGNASDHRSVLEEYSTALLDQLVAISTSATIICYALYTILKTPGEEQVTGVAYFNPMVYTLPFVIFGIFRYLYLVYKRDEGGAPEHLLINDHVLLVNVLLWLVVAVWVLIRT